MQTKRRLKSPLIKRRCISSSENDVDAGALEPPQQPLQETRRDLQQVVGLERVRARRAHMMQRQDGADAADQRPHEMMHAR